MKNSENVVKGGCFENFHDRECQFFFQNEGELQGLMCKNNALLTYWDASIKFKYHIPHPL